MVNDLKSKIIKERGFQGLSCFLVAIIWSLPSLLNDFPMSYYDTAFYLHNAINITDPSPLAWRPIAYSLFMQPVFWGLGLLGFVVLQNFVVAICCFATARTLIPNFSNFSFVFLGVLLYLTPLPYISNFLMPDIFAGLTLLMFIGYFCAERQYKKYFLIPCLLFAFTHYSNVIFIFPILVLAHPFFRKRIVQGLLVFVLLILSLRFTFFFPKNNYEQTAHLFLFSRFVHYKITDVYFSENCPIKDNIFCENNDIAFDLWKMNKVVRQDNQKYNLGKKNIIAAPSNINSIVSTNQQIMKSRLFAMYFVKSIKQTFQQVISFSQPMEYVTNDANLLIYMTNIGNLRQFTQQKIFNDKELPRALVLSYLSLLYFATACLSILAILISLIRQQVSPDLVSGTILAVITYFISAFAIGFLSVPLPRYSNRFIWIFGYISLLILFRFFQRKKENSLA